ncbi:MAG: phosphatase PAP2 family protein [Candidatus Dadabacteria bacterium]|nr:phosphatase PAP2 family protein [Candidatus Dadabacteria bacterium]
MRAQSPRLSLRETLRSAGSWKVLVFIGLVAYCYAMHKITGVRPDHFFLSLIIVVFLFFGREWGKRFLIDWSPFIIFWILYDMMRGVADSVRGRIFISGPYNIELGFFGWMIDGTIPAFYLRQFQLDHRGELIKTLIDIFTTSIYVLHFIAPLLLGWFLWHTLSERRNYYLFVYTFTVLNVMALVTFMVFPVAPPWYVYSYGFEQPDISLIDSSGGLVNFDELTGTKYMQTLWNTFNSNRFAAIPSLHAGYPTVIALIVWLRFGGWTWIIAGYPLSAWFSAVYLNHHYIIDLVIGSSYVIAAYFITRKFLMPHIFDRLVDYEAAPAGRINKS